MNSFFSITTNPKRWQFPYLESIESVLPYADEVIIVDGGSTDGSMEEIKKLSDKIRIVCDADTKWEDEWVYWRMGHNLARAFSECRGDWVFKFDMDYVFKEGYRLRSELRACDACEAVVLGLDRYNLQVIDRYFRKSVKTLAVNMRLCRQKGLNVKWGYDIPHFGLGDDAIVFEKFENNINQGKLLSHFGDKAISGLEIFNYGYCFKDEETAKEAYYRNMRAMHWQENQDFVTNPDKVWREYKAACMSNFKKQYTKLRIDQHPLCIQERIKNLTPRQQGYDFWGGHERAKYYGKN